MGEQELRDAMRAAVRDANGQAMAALERLFETARSSPPLAQAIERALHGGSWRRLVRQEIASAR